MEVLIEQHSSSEVSGGIPSSRRLLALAHLDLWTGLEVSAVRRLVSSAAFAVSFAIAVLLTIGY